jgi:hypothetical protein
MEEMKLSKTQTQNLNLLKIFGFVLGLFLMAQMLSAQTEEIKLDKSHKGAVCKQQSATTPQSERI